MSGCSPTSQAKFTSSHIIKQGSHHCFLFGLILYSNLLSNWQKIILVFFFFYYVICMHGLPSVHEADVIEAPGGGPDEHAATTPRLASC
jgi:hypothetical protein